MKLNRTEERYTWSIDAKLAHNGQLGSRGAGLKFWPWLSCVTIYADPVGKIQSCLKFSAEQRQCYTRMQSTTSGRPEDSHHLLEHHPNATGLISSQYHWCSRDSLIQSLNVYVFTSPYLRNCIPISKQCKLYSPGLTNAYNAARSECVRNSKHYVQ